MDKHRRHIFIALVLVLLIIAAALAWATGADILKGSPKNQPTPAVSGEVSASTAPVQSAAPSASPSAAPSAEPTATASAAPTATPTPAPTATPKPVQSRSVNESGSIYSNTGSNINMRVDWHVTSASNTELKLDVNVYITSYAIKCNSKEGFVRIAGKEYDFVTDPLVSSQNEYLQDTLIYSNSVTIPADAGETVAIPIYASWRFDGVYSGVEVGRITAEKTITIQG